jgi:uncharacterized repeat protein (TIGR04138 family)
MQHQGILEVVRQDPRYAYEAYEFLFEALAHTQRRLDRIPPEDPERAAEGDYHVSGAELVDGFLDLARERFGRLARIVLHLWGVDQTDDVGELVFNLIDSELLSKTDKDCRADFQGLCNLDETLVDRFEIAWER